MSRIEYRPPAAAAGVEILVKQGVIAGSNFTKFFGVPYVVLPSAFFSGFSGNKYFIPYSFTIETTDVAIPVIVPINLKFDSALTALTQVLPTQGSALYTCGIIPFNGANQFDQNGWLQGDEPLLLTATVDSPLASYDDAKYTLLYSLITIV
jgi:hypothetical protein